MGAGGQSLFLGLTSGVTKAIELQEVWRSTDRGATCQNMGGLGSGPGNGLPGTIENGAFVGINSDGQGETNFALRADPINPNIVYISGDTTPPWNRINADPTMPAFPNQIGANSTNGSLFRGDASLGLSSPPTVANWTLATPYNGQWLPITDAFAAKTTPHADSRTLTFDNNGNLLETNDGGVYRRSDPQSNTGQWTSLIGNLQLTEIHGISYDSNTHTLISGNQDNGAGYQNQVNGKIWTLQLHADGGQTAVNDQNAAFSVRYISSQALSDFTRVKVETNNSILEVQPTTLLVNGTPLPTGPTSGTPDEAPVRVNQQDKSMLAFGTDVVYLTTDDVNATPLNPNLYLTPINTTRFDSQVADIAYGRPGNANLLLAAEGNRLWLSSTLQAGSLHRLPYPGSADIISVCINPNSDSLFYVADGRSVRSNTGAQASEGRGQGPPPPEQPAQG